MNKKIFQTVFFSVLLTLLLVLAVSLSVLYASYENRIEDDLSAEIRFLAAAAEDGMANVTAVSVPGHRVTVIAQDGTVLYESEGNAEDMENHLERPEVQEAIRYGFGEDRRESGTLLQELSDGGQNCHIGGCGCGPKCQTTDQGKQYALCCILRAYVPAYYLFIYELFSVFSSHMSYHDIRSSSKLVYIVDVICYNSKIKL